MEKFPIEVQVHATPNIDSVTRAYRVLDWMSDKGFVASRDYEIDMHGGLKGYTSFWFKSKKKALLTKLTW